MYILAEAVKDLKDKEIKSISLNPDRDKMILHTCDDDYLFEACGDCCSDSWIEHIELVIFPCKLIDIKEIDLPDDYEKNVNPTTTEHEEYEMKYYFYEIVTDKGAIAIEMRNSSNGYYGGSLTYCGKIKEVLCG